MIERGRRLVALDIALMLIVSVAMIALYVSRAGPDRLPYQVIRLVITIALCRAVYRGDVMGRYVAAILFGLACVLAAAQLPTVLRGGDFVLVLLVTWALISYGFVAANLFWSSSVAAFQAHQRQQRSRPLSAVDEPGITG